MAATRHHYVPQGFLRGFSVPCQESRNFVWVYDKRDSRVPRIKSVRSIAWAHAYYAQECEDGAIDTDTREDALAGNIDNEIPGIIRSINPEIGQSVELDADQRETFAFFIGLSMTRVPSFREGITEFYSRIAQIGLEHVLADNPELRPFAEQYGVTAEAKSWVSLEPMIKMARMIADSALNKNWQFFMPPREVPLVTSDNPVVFSAPGSQFRPIGPAHPDCELLVNIRSDLSLVCTPKSGYPQGKVFSLRPAEARKFNRGIVRAARYRVFSNFHSQEFDRFVKKYSGKEQKIIG